jgi:hypothetical protein
MTTLIVIALLICGIAGSLIGRPKGYPVWGFFLGLFLGVLGVAVMTLWRPRPNSPKGRQA